MAGSAFLSALILLFELASTDLATGEAVSVAYMNGGDPPARWHAAGATPSLLVLESLSATEPVAAVVTVERSQNEPTLFVVTFRSADGLPVELGAVSLSGVMDELYPLHREEVRNIAVSGVVTVPADDIGETVSADIDTVESGTVESDTTEAAIAVFRQGDSWIAHTTQNGAILVFTILQN